MFCFIVDFNNFVCQQIGCFMGFSIVICVFTGAMFITYCIALAELSEIINCKDKLTWDWDYDYSMYSNEYEYCYSSSDRHLAAVGLGLGSCMLIFTIAEFITALTSAIYCCNAVCCNSSTGVMNNVNLFSYFCLHFYIN